MFTLLHFLNLTHEDSTNHPLFFYLLLHESFILIQATRFRVLFIIIQIKKRAYMSKYDSSTYLKQPY